MDSLESAKIQTWSPPPASAMPVSDLVTDFDMALLPAPGAGIIIG